jgi:hypothetical protein
MIILMTFKYLAGRCLSIIAHKNGDAVLLRIPLFFGGGDEDRTHDLSFS